MKILGMITYTGKDFNVENLERDGKNMVCIEDIVHSLSRTPRYNGHTELPYYVAQHVCHAYDIMKYVIFKHETNLPENKLRGSHWERALNLIHVLHHDDTEAYVGDMPSPIKRHVHGFKDIEEKIYDCAINPYWCNYYKFHTGSSNMFPYVKDVDMVMLNVEKYIYMPYDEDDFEWSDVVENNGLWKQYRSEILKLNEVTGDPLEYWSHWNSDRCSKEYYKRVRECAEMVDMSTDNVLTQHLLSMAQG